MAETGLNSVRECGVVSELSYFILGIFMKCSSNEVPPPLTASLRIHEFRVAKEG